MSARTEAVPSPRTLGAAWRVFVGFASPMLLLLGAVGATGYRATLPSWSWVDAAIPLGLIAAWPFVEWLIHVLLLHWTPRVVLGITIDPANARAHRTHHRNPNELLLLFIPVHTYLYAAPAIVAPWLLLLPASQAWTGIAATLLLALHYEWSHYLAHIQYTPKIGFYQRVCRHHVLHHFKSEKHWFGVSMTFADRVIGTSPPADQVPKSPTCKTLGVEPLSAD